jgi:F0F1-type ATP synthase delta subunit
MDIGSILLPIVVAHAVVLVVLVLVIRRLLLSDTLNAIEKIRQVETEVRKREETVRREIEEHEAELARRKQEAEDALQKHKQEMDKELSRLREQVTVEAKREGEKIMDQARRSEEKLRQQILQDMEEKAVQYGAEVFKLVCSERMTQELNHQFVSELLDALDEVDSNQLTVESGEAEFVVSHPLAPDVRQRLVDLLRSKFGAEVTVRETLDSSLLSGLILKIGSMEIDGSLRTRLTAAAGEVKKQIKM